MKTINVEDLPEPVTAALEAVIRTLRTQFGKHRTDLRTRVKLLTKPGRALTDLGRDEIYADVG
jgi:hypothetical protein